MKPIKNKKRADPRYFLNDPLNEIFMEPDERMVKKIIKAVLSVTDTRYQPGLDQRTLFDHALDNAVKDGLLDRNPNHYSPLEARTAFQRIRDRGVRYALDDG